MLSLYKCMTTYFVLFSDMLKSVRMDAERKFREEHWGFTGEELDLIVSRGGKPWNYEEAVGVLTKELPETWGHGPPLSHVCSKPK